MRFVPVLVIAIAATLGAPAAEASELVKLAKLIVTGKRTPTVPATEAAKPAPTPAPAAAAPRADTPAAPGAERMPALGADGLDLQDAPRLEAPQRSERVGVSGVRASHAS